MIVTIILAGVATTGILRRTLVSSHSFDWSVASDEVAQACSQVARARSGVALVLITSIAFWQEWFWNTHGTLLTRFALYGALWTPYTSETSLPDAVRSFLHAKPIFHEVTSLNASNATVALMHGNPRNGAPHGGVDVRHLQHLHLNVIELRADPKVAHLDGHDESWYNLRLLVHMYDRLGDNEPLIFAHAHSRAWHHSRPLEAQLGHLVKSRYFKDRDFGAVYCEHWIHNFAPTGAVNTGLFAWSVPVPELVETLWKHAFFNTTVVNDLPHHFEYPCCGTFFVRGRSIRRRHRQDYEKILKNLAWIAHKEPWMHEQRQVGRILESAWHVIFQGENGNSQKDCTDNVVVDSK